LKPITVTRTINAPVEVVFQTVADIREIGKALPHVIGLEFLTGKKPVLARGFVKRAY